MFRDGKGRSWTFQLTINDVKRVKQKLDIDLMTLPDFKSGLLEKITSDVVLMVDLAYVLLMPQAEQQQVSDEDFGTSITSADILADLRDAMLEGIVDFFPMAAKAALKKVITTAQQAESRLTKKVLEMVDQTTIDVDQILSGMLSGNSPESSDAETQAPTA